MIEILTDVMIGGLGQGLILAVLVLGVMIPFKLLDFPDLTAEGSYPLGGCVYGALLVSGFNLPSSIIIATIIAGVAGVCTALIHLRYKVNTLLAGIIVSTMIYSVNLRVMGKPSLIIPNTDSFINYFLSGLNLQIITLLLINIFLLSAILLFLRTEQGLRFRAVGLNPNFAKRQSVNINHNVMFGLFIGNCLSGLAGVLFVQIYGYADIGMSLGIIIQALAAMMIGEKVIGNNSLIKTIAAPLVGAIIYQQIQGMALLVGLAPSDLKFMTGAIILSIIALR
ncbi:MAG: hypothetical protein DGJ47_000169 [Rickettsiaceae bacterium]